MSRRESEGGEGAERGNRTDTKTDERTGSKERGKIRREGEKRERE
jgi:hypothetical protein